MNNEIIELLLYKLEQNYKCEKENYFILYKPDIKDLLDYITNLQQRINKAIEFVELNPLIWKPNMELSKLIENPDLKGRLFYTADEWLNKLHTILKGDDEK